MTNTQKDLEIPCVDGSLSLKFEPGQSIVFLGANGSGKTRLGVYLEQNLPHTRVHRISAQRSLSLNENVDIVSPERAEAGLRYGYDSGGAEHRIGNRWGSKPATYLLNDFDFLQKALFAEHAAVAARFYKESADGQVVQRPMTKLTKLTTAWKKLLPHRELIVESTKILVSPHDAYATPVYSGSEMSDGERVIFYLLGQVIMAPEDCVLIIDEPECHVHKAILGLLWTTMELERPDCSLVYMTHDLNFSVEDHSRQVYILNSFRPFPQAWDILKIDLNSQLPERVVVELIGSRRPVLFVEGTRGSIDTTIYSVIFSEFVICPVGSCDAVIHAVSTFNRNAIMHRMSAKGLVDRDARDETAIAALGERSISVLPVAEVENILLLPNVFRALALALACHEPETCLTKLCDLVVSEASKNIVQVCRRYTHSELDTVLKRFEVDSLKEEPTQFDEAFRSRLSEILPSAIYQRFYTNFQTAISSRDLEGMLKIYDNKGLLKMASSILGVKHDQLMTKVKFILNDATVGEQLKNEIVAALPAIAV